MSIKYKHLLRFAYESDDLPTSDDLSIDFVDIEVTWKEGSVVFGREGGLIHCHTGALDLVGYGSEYKVDTSVTTYTPESLLKVAAGCERLVITVYEDNFTTALSPRYTSVERESVEDYPGMITDLEKHGIVSCFPSTSFLATDPRSFIYKGESYQVDCLGTYLCQDISKIISAEWSFLH